MRGECGGSVERLASLDMPMGLDSAWTEIEAVLGRGDMLLMVSDGVLDRIGGRVEDLMTVIGELNAQPVPLTAEQFAQALCFGEAHPLAVADDVTAVILRRDGGSP
jgi:phosphoserine phosphatase RsbU/P